MMGYDTNPVFSPDGKYVAFLSMERDGYESDRNRLFVYEMASGKKLNVAIMDCLKPMIKDVLDVVCFDGNGYSDEWKAEAARRGLDCETSAPLIIDRYLDEKAVDMFGKVGVLSLNELRSRCEVKWENYSMKLQIESRVLGDMVRNHVLPAAQRYQSILLDNVLKLNDVFGKAGAEAVTAEDKDMIRKIGECNSTILRLVDEMTDARAKANHVDDERERAVMFHDTIVPMMEEIREKVDALEMIVDDELWTLPKYREMLFIR